MGLLCAALGAACGDDSSGSFRPSAHGSALSRSSTSSLPVGDVRRLAAKSRLAVAAYRAFSAGYVACFNKLDAGVLQTTADFASCTDDGLVTTKLVGSTHRLRAQLATVTLNASGVCRATAQQLAEAAEEAERRRTPSTATWESWILDRSTTIWVQPRRRSAASAG